MRGRSEGGRAPFPRGYWTVWTTVALDLVGFGIIAPILPLYAERFGASPTTIGFLFASYSAAQFVFAPILGRLSDRIGRKPVILISLFGTAVGSLVTGVAGAVWVLFVGRIIDGASGASVSVAQGAVTDLTAPADRARALGLLGAAFGVGFVVGPALGGLAELGGAHIPFFVAGAIALVNGIVAIRRLPETHLDRAPAVGRVARGERSTLRRFVVVAFLATASFASFEATFSLLANRRFDLGPGAVSVVFVVIGLFLVAVQGGVVGRVTARLGPLNALRTSLFVIAVGLAMLGVATRWAVLVPALALLVLGQGISTPTIAALVANRADHRRRGGALGAQQSAGALARVVGPAAGGALFHHVGIPAPYLIGAALVALAAVTLSLDREPQQTPSGVPS
ncbi:MAG: transporter, family, tetracycline resistance protein [Acidimicrobiaceae bacterium]|nr:transporter, family, tetracycline resistance protein [Acidimicrobiaceae bacterium]